MSLINLIEFPILGDERGSLISLEAMKNIPFEIKRVYYIFGANDQPRGFHAHKELQQCAIAISGSCRVVMDNGQQKEDIWLNSPNKGLLIKNEWHEMHDFSSDCVLLVLASEHYDESDYIRNYEEFTKKTKLQLVPYTRKFLNKSRVWFQNEELRKLTMTPSFTVEQQEEFYKSLPSRLDYLIYGITYNDFPIGACGLKNVTQKNAELWLYIGEIEFQSQKLGPVILEKLESIAKEKNIQSLYLKVSEQNLRAIKLYNKYGFNKIDHIENYWVMEKNMTIKVERYIPDNKLLWNEFLSNCKNSHFMFNRDFMEYHSHLFKDHSLIIKDHKDKIIALLPANIENNILYSHQGLTFGGFLINQKMSAPTMLQIFMSVISFLQERKVNKFIYKCIPYIYSSIPCQEDLYALFRTKAKLYRRDISSAINLETIPPYSKGRKWGINRAKKNNVNISICNKASDVWPLIETVLEEQHQASPTHSGDEIDLLQTQFPNNIRAYKAHLDEEIIAAAVLFETPFVSHTQYLAVNSIGRDVSALDYLIAEIIEDRKNKVKYFDFGISNENSGHYLNEGLISQKEGFGARSVAHDFYEIEI